MRNLYIILAVLGCLSISPRASAIESLTAIQLQEVCSDAERMPEAAGTRLCVFYVKGVLDGAVATDRRVAESMVAEVESKESFAERAIRTRAINRLRDPGASVYAEFCVGQPDPIADVVLHVVDELARYDDLENVQAQTVVYDSLRRNYPCVTN